MHRAQIKKHTQHNTLKMRMNFALLKLMKLIYDCLNSNANKMCVKSVWWLHVNMYYYSYISNWIVCISFKYVLITLGLIRYWHSIAFTYWLMSNIVRYFGDSMTHIVSYHVSCPTTPDVRSIAHLDTWSAHNSIWMGIFGFCMELFAYFA